MTQIKICGLLPGDDLTFVQNPAVTHVGVIFVPASKRYVTPREAELMVSEVNHHAAVMGVFSNSTVDQILSTLTASGAHGAQLHGEESAKQCAELRLHGFAVWKALRVTSAMTGEQLYDALMPFASDADVILLDAAPPADLKPGVTGGHGIPFRWKVLEDFADYAHQKNHPLPPLWIAGGLTAQNVGELLATFQPQGVDISSGVETEGRKDPIRIEAFIRAVLRDESSVSISN